MKIRNAPPAAIATDDVYKSSQIKKIALVFSGIESSRRCRRIDIKEELHSKLSHDLRSKLNVILGYCELIAEDLEAIDTGHSALEDLAVVRRASDELLLINDEIRALWNGLSDDMPQQTVALSALLEPVQSSHRERYGRAPSLGGDMGSRVPEGLRRVLQSIFRKLCLALSDSCAVEVAHQGNVLTLGLRVPAPSRQKLASFISKYESTDSEADARNDFDRYYALAAGASLGLELQAAMSEAAEDAAATLTMSWRSEAAG